MAAKQSKPIWERKAPADAKHSQLSKSKKASAKASAKRAGRPYPNLVDNMRAAQKKSPGRKAARKKTARKSATGKKTAHGRVKRGALKAPQGGLTAAGRRWFEKTQGAHLKPGVKKSRGEMSAQEMRRKGSWAVRFYGRKGTLPALKQPDGSPTRYALTAAAWGEAVPKTAAAARRIAARGHRLLAAYAKLRA